MKSTTNRYNNSKALGIADIAYSYSEIFCSLYFVLDHILLLNRINAVKFSPTFVSKVDFWANMCWLHDTLGCLVGDIVEYLALSRELKRIRESLIKVDNKESTGKIFS